jgi:hypothetical protein
MDRPGDEGDAGSSAEAGIDSIRPRGGVQRCPVCEVKLSSYNPGPNCWQHTIGWPWRGPSAKPRF